MRVAVMFDGTWNTPSDHTNVYRLKRAIADIDPEGTRQLIWYHEGVGTSWHGRLLGGAFGYGLSEIIRAAFQWLCENFKPSDELYVFGFSRGAYSARSFVGLIRKCGVLRSPTDQQIKDAYDLYRKKGDDPDGPEATNFRALYSWETRVKFVGVWDTVGSLGIPVTGLKLPFFRDYYVSTIRSFQRLSTTPITPWRWMNSGRTSRQPFGRKRSRRISASSSAGSPARTRMWAGAAKAGGFTS